MPDQMNTDEFAERIKKKYPEYADIDNTELTNKIISKYPEYKSQVNLTPTKEVPSSEVSFDSTLGGIIPSVGGKQVSWNDYYNQRKDGEVVETKDTIKQFDTALEKDVQMQATTYKTAGQLILGTMASSAVLGSTPMQLLLPKIAKLPYIGKIASSAIQGGLGYTSYTAATDLPEVINQEITLEDYGQNLLSSAKIGSVIGGGVGALSTGLSGLAAIKTTRLTKAWNKAPIRKPLKGLKLTNAQAKQTWETPSAIKGGHQLKNQLIMRDLAEKPLDVRDAKVLNKMLTGKYKTTLSQEEAIKANRTIETLVGTGEFHPGYLRSPKGLKTLAKKINKINKMLKDPSKANIETMTHGFVPGYAQAERYGFKELTKSVDAAKVKTARQTGNAFKAYDKVFKSLGTGYKESSSKIAVALEPKVWNISKSEQLKLVKSMTPAEQKALRFYKKRVDFYKGRLKAAGIPVQEEGYFTHIRKKLVEHIQEAPNNKPALETIQEINSGFSKARTLNGKGFSLDVDKVLRQYENSMIRTFNDNKVEQLTKSFLKTHDLTKSNQHYIKRTINEDIFGRNENDLKMIEKWKSTLAQQPKMVRDTLKSLGLGSKDPASSLTNLAIRGIARAKLGAGNYKFLIRNFTTQRYYADMFTDVASGAQAEAILLQPGKAKALLNNSRVFQIYDKLSSGHALTGLGLEDEAARLANSSSIARKMGIGIKRGAKGAADFLGRLGYYPVSASARNNAARSYIQGYVHAKKLGVGEMGARLAGDYVAETTQYVYTYTNKLQAFRGPLGRLYGLFGSWSPNHFQMLRKAMGAKPFYKWTMNVGVTSAIAAGLGKVDPYFKSAQLNRIYSRLPINRNLLETPLDLAEGVVKWATTGDDRTFKRGFANLIRWYQPPKGSFGGELLNTLGE